MLWSLIFEFQKNWLWEPPFPWHADVPVIEFGNPTPLGEYLHAVPWWNSVGYWPMCLTSTFINGRKQVLAKWNIGILCPWRVFWSKTRMAILSMNPPHQNSTKIKRHPVQPLEFLAASQNNNMEENELLPAPLPVKCCNVSLLCSLGRKKRIPDSDDKHHTGQVNSNTWPERNYFLFSWRCAPWQRKERQSTSAESSPRRSPKPATRSLLVGCFASC